MKRSEITPTRGGPTFRRPDADSEHETRHVIVHRVRAVLDATAEICGTRHDVKSYMTVEQPVAWTIGSPCHEHRVRTTQIFRNVERTLARRKPFRRELCSTRDKPKIEAVQMHRMISGRGIDDVPSKRVAYRRTTSLGVCPRFSTYRV